MTADQAAQLWAQRQHSGIEAWRAAVAAKGSSYFPAKRDPEAQIERMKALYVEGKIDHTSFEMSVSAALGLPVIALGSRFAPDPRFSFTPLRAGVSGVPLGRVV